MPNEKNEKALNQTIVFDPKRYTKKTLQLILEKAQQCECSPAEAQTLLLNELVSKQTKGGN